MSWAAEMEERLCQCAWRIINAESLGSEARSDVMVVLSRGLTCVEARIHSATDGNPGRWLASVGYDSADRSYYRVRREALEP